MPEPDFVFNIDPEDFERAIDMVDKLLVIKARIISLEISTEGTPLSDQVKELHETFETLIEDIPVLHTEHIHHTMRDLAERAGSIKAQWKKLHGLPLNS